MLLGRVRSAELCGASHNGAFAPHFPPICCSLHERGLKLACCGQETA
jgi:hypothetical protein